ncbi:uncharacterized protein LY89DRAFT_707319 [Mollisia scopiformis]|uniref:Rhodopsin domain-containing protein n=1 Tax=Mollisia scopiformis TaxID=149040 RepID=A0A194X9M8_MOLSC|nr:uncharacterized protein LY89DRAFT_707319 [Mollisia scopiformis]KUJ16890.1 hypothetical protein LY89DRAFT_707319 [Mollisia scopiformis]
MGAIPEKGLVALTWIFTATALLLTAGRYGIRYRLRREFFRAFQLDDFFHGLACLALIGYMITSNLAFSLEYKIAADSSGFSSEEPTVDDLSRYFHFIIAISAIFWVVQYLVKLAFLAFYRSLFFISDGFMRAWWCVLVFTLVTFLANFISVFWSCGAPKNLYVVEKCSSLDSEIVIFRFVKMWCILNVLSDVAIMTLPLWMLKGTRLPIGQKVGVAVIFLLAFTDVIFDILRTLYTLRGGAVSIDILWDILELTIAIIISALPTYRSLLPGSSHKVSTSYKDLDNTGRQLKTKTASDGIVIKKQSYF